MGALKLILLLATAGIAISYGGFIGVGVWAIAIFILFVFSDSFDN